MSQAGRATAVLAVLFGGVAHAQQPARWRLVEEWRVGGAVDGPHSLNDVRAIRPLADGRIVVLEGKDQQLHILSNRGVPIKTIGRRGAGPGEFRNANGFIISPAGQIIVHDPGNARLTFLTFDGDVVKTVPHAPWAEGGTWFARFLADGRLEEDADIPVIDPTMPVITQSTQARRPWSADFARMDTVTSPECANLRTSPPNEMSWQRPQGRGFMSAMYPFVMRDRARISAADGTFWIGTYPEYRTIHRVTFGTCTVVATVSLREPQVAIPPGVLNPILAQYVRNGEGAPNPTAPTPDRVRRTLPHFESMTVDAMNQLWVERLVAATIKFDGTTVTGDRRFDVYSPQGRLLAEVAAAPRMGTPRGGKAFTIANDRVYAIATDADEIPYLVVYRIERN